MRSAPSGDRRQDRRPVRRDERTPNAGRFETASLTRKDLRPSTTSAMLNRGGVIGQQDRSPRQPAAKTACAQISAAYATSFRPAKCPGGSSPVPT
jgi:hypothetical protein